MAKKKIFIILLLFLGIQSTAYSQKKSWFVFQPNAQGKNIQFTENSISVSSKNYPKPIHPFTKVPFSSYLALNCQNDTQGNLIFYLLSTKDSVFLFDSTNYFIQAFKTLDMSPLIVPMPDGLSYHLLMGGLLYVYRTRNPDNFIDNYSVNMETKINQNAQKKLKVTKRTIEIITMNCDYQEYVIHSIVANMPGYTGRYIYSIKVKCNSFDNYYPDFESTQFDITAFTANEFEYSVAEQEISPSKNRLLFNSKNRIMIFQISNHKVVDTLATLNLNELFPSLGISILGAEFINDSLGLVSLYSMFDTLNSNQGIYIFKIKNNKITDFHKLKNSYKFKYSFIEKGLNKKIYFPYNDGLYFYNRLNDSCVKESMINCNFMPSIDFLNQLSPEFTTMHLRLFYLPNQIDDYNNESQINISNVVDFLKINKSGNFHFTNHKLTKYGKGPIYVIDSLHLTSNAKYVNFDSMQIYFYKYAKFNLLKNNHLTLKGTTLKGMCGQMWDGVKILPLDSGSSITIQKNKYGKNSMIRDASIAAIKSYYSKNKLNISDNTVFTANKIDLHIQNGKTENINIYNCKFLDTTKHNYLNSSTLNAMLIENSNVKIGNVLQGNNYIIGGVNGIELINNTKITIDNFIIDKCSIDAIFGLKNNIVSVLNSKLVNTQNGVELVAFDNFNFKSNTLEGFLNSGVSLDASKFNSVLIGGSNSSKNIFNHCGNFAVGIKGSTTAILNSNYIGAPTMGDLSGAIRPNTFLNKWGNISINNNVFYDTSLSNIGISITSSVISKKQIDTFQINFNKFTYSENAISLNNISSIDCLNTLLPKSENIPNCYGNKNIYKNIISDNGKINSNKIGILLNNCSNIYIGNDRILNNSKNSVGIRIQNSTSCLVYSDTIFNSNIGLYTTGNNLYNNYYCNYFNRNLFGIKLFNSTLRNQYNSFYFPANYKKIVHGEISILNQTPFQYIARDNRFISPMPGGAYINNDLIGNQNYIKWDFSPLNFSSSMRIKFLSDKTKNQFINHNNAINTCSNPIQNPGAFEVNSSDSIITCTEQSNEFDSFWINYYIAQKAQSGQLQVNNAIPFCNQLVTLQKKMDNSSYTDIVNYYNSMQLNSQCQQDIHFIYGKWIQYLSNIDTISYRPNKFGNIKQWITDSTYNLQNVLLDSFGLQTRFKPLPDSTINQIYNIAKLNASTGSPSVYFARNSLNYMGKYYIYNDSIDHLNLSILGQVTNNCSGGGVSGIVVKLLDQNGIYTGLTETTQDFGYFKFDGIQLKNLNQQSNYYIRAYFPNDTLHTTYISTIENLQLDSALVIDCNFPSAPPVPGVKNIESKTEISPNPASKSVTIKNLSEDCNKMTLLNNLGQALIEIELIDYQEERNLDISKYTNGIYYIRLDFNQSEKVVKKFIIQN